MATGLRAVIGPATTTFWYLLCSVAIKFFSISNAGFSLRALGAVEKA